MKCHIFQHKIGSRGSKNEKNILQRTKISRVWVRLCGCGFFHGRGCGCGRGCGRLRACGRVRAPGRWWLGAFWRRSGCGCVCVYLRAWLSARSLAHLGVGLGFNAWECVCGREVLSFFSRFFFFFFFFFIFKFFLGVDFLIFLIF